MNLLSDREHYKFVFIKRLKTSAAIFWLFCDILSQTVSLILWQTIIAFKHRAISLRKTKRTSSTSDTHEPTSKLIKIRILIDDSYFLKDFLWKQHELKLPTSSLYTQYRYIMTQAPTFYSGLPNRFGKNLKMYQCLLKNWN